jgi:hypothetical protein
MFSGILISTFPNRAEVELFQYAHCTCENQGTKELPRDKDSIRIG